MEDQPTISFTELFSKLLGPRGVKHCRFRVHMVFEMGDHRAPLAIYKQVGLQCWDVFDRDWSDYGIENRSMLPQGESNLASDDLRVLYLSRRLLFAWQYCVE